MKKRKRGKDTRGRPITNCYICIPFGSSAIRPWNHPTHHNFEAMVLTGVCKFFNLEKGFGFIVPDDGGDDIFVHKNQCSDSQNPNEGDALTYEVAWDTGKGKNYAVRVTGGTGGDIDRALAVGPTMPRIPKWHGVGYRTCHVRNQTRQMPDDPDAARLMQQIKQADAACGCDCGEKVTGDADMDSGAFDHLHGGKQGKHLNKEQRIQSLLKGGDTTTAKDYLCRLLNKQLDDEEPTDLVDIILQEHPGYVEFYNYMHRQIGEDANSDAEHWWDQWEKDRGESWNQWGSGAAEPRVSMKGEGEIRDFFSCCECKLCGILGQGCNVGCSEMVRVMTAHERGGEPRALNLLGRMSPLPELNAKEDNPKLCGDCRDHGLLTFRREAVQRARAARQRKLSPENDEDEPMTKRMHSATAKDKEERTFFKYYVVSFQYYIVSPLGGYTSLECC